MNKKKLLKEIYAYGSMSAAAEFCQEEQARSNAKKAATQSLAVIKDALNPDPQHIKESCDQYSLSDMRPGDRFYFITDGDMKEYDCDFGGNQFGNLAYFYNGFYQKSITMSDHYIKVVFLHNAIDKSTIEELFNQYIEYRKWYYRNRLITHADRADDPDLAKDCIIDLMNMMINKINQVINDRIIGDPINVKDIIYDTVKEEIRDR